MLVLGLVLGLGLDIGLGLGLGLIVDGYRSVILLVPRNTGPVVPRSAHCDEVTGVGEVDHTNRVEVVRREDRDIVLGVVCNPEIGAIGEDIGRYTSRGSR